MHVLHTCTYVHMCTGHLLYMYMFFVHTVLLSSSVYNTCSMCCAVTIHVLVAVFTAGEESSSRCAILESWYELHVARLMATVLSLQSSTLYMYRCMYL